MMRGALLTTLLAVLPRAVLACPVCFGQNDSPLALGINYGIRPNFSERLADRGVKLEPELFTLEPFVRRVVGLR